MNPIDIVTRRTGMSDDDAEFYVNMAEIRVKAYLGLDAAADLTPYAFQIADIAVLYWQKDKSTKQTVSTLGYSSKSISEGGVSKSETGMTGAELVAVYESAIDDVLASMNKGAGMVVFM